jgi:hemerythrin superfamily protein
MAAKLKKLPEIATGGAIPMLIADHKRVAKLFAEFAALSDEGTDAEKSKIVTAICQELIVHTTLEEEIFYPAVRAAIDDEDQMDEALVEHDGAKQLIAQLQQANADDDLYEAKVTVLGEQIDHHVTEEEGSMFPKARHAGVDTPALAERMQARKSELLAGGDHLASASDLTPRSDAPKQKIAPKAKTPSRSGKGGKNAGQLHIGRGDMGEPRKAPRKR